MKRWQRKVKLKPGYSLLHFRGLVPYRRGEEHQIELMESIYRKENFWPDRLTPLTEEELRFKDECEASRPTFEEACKAFSEMNPLDPPLRRPVLINEKMLKGIDKWLAEH